jgi:hypothetical protein
MQLIEKCRLTFTINQGLTSLEVPHIFDQLLGLQLINGTRGDILEIGVLEGATIAFIANSLQDVKRAFLIDPYQDMNHIKEIVAKFAGISLGQVFGLQITLWFSANDFV